MVYRGAIERKIEVMDFLVKSFDFPEICNGEVKENTYRILVETCIETCEMVIEWIGDESNKYSLLIDSCRYILKRGNESEVFNTLNYINWIMGKDYASIVNDE